ncbi:TSUP family transporter [Lacibacter sp. MH-610]|uniref:TSUP family transporter n=1 Tax=Lacibacter sp. MH-610 TaxID=3020883 RepID=UPI003891AB04
MEQIKDKNQLYPVFLKLEQLQVLLVGAGNVGLEKLQSLLVNSPDAYITIVAPFVKEELRTFISSYQNCKLVERSFEEDDLNGKELIVLATDDQELHRYIYSVAKERKILINVADTPELCDFYLGSIVQKGNLKIAISTNGKSPTVAKRLKEVLNDAMPAELDDVLENMNKVRSKLNGNFEYKVKKLNALTKVLVADETAESTERKWKKIATYSLLAFALMLIGHFIFSYIPFRQMADDTVAWYKTLDKNIHWMVLAGFLAQMVDGALGMGYGVTSASVLMTTGISPAAISGAIHTSEIFASASSGYSHYRFGNVNKKLFKALVIPGVIGAAVGAVFLVTIGEEYGSWMRPAIAVYTLLLGIKFIINAFREMKPQKKFKRYRLLAAFGGFFDSFGGGGWGPIVTSTLINNGRSHKYVIGSVSLTEFFITLTSAFTFFTLIGVSHWQVIVALMLGSFIAAPLAARLAGKLPKKTSYLLLGILVIIWSGKILVKIL